MQPTPLSHWLGFHLALLLLLGVELLYARVGLQALAPEAKARRQRRTAIIATAMWVSAALAFSGFLLRSLGSTAATQFLAGYAIEEALSVDNLFVFLLLFRVFKIPSLSQPRVLFWGVLGAILMRGGFIVAGVDLLARFQWVSYVFAVILLGAAIRLVLPEEQALEEEVARPPIWIRWVARIHPVSLRNDVFFSEENGTRMISMLFLSLLAIEVTDVVFALDSIPAVLSITRHPFIAYTSNILAVMSLRSLFFLLARALKQLRFLHYGLAAVLAFAAIKMLISRVYEVGPLPSLAVIVAILTVTILLSLFYKRSAT